MKRVNFSVGKIKSGTLTGRPDVRDKIRKSTSTGYSAIFKLTLRGFVTTAIYLKMSGFNQVNTNYILLGNEIGGRERIIGSLEAFVLDAGERKCLFV